MVEDDAGAGDSPNRLEVEVCGITTIRAAGENALEQVKTTPKRSANAARLRLYMMEKSALRSLL